MYILLITVITLILIGCTKQEPMPIWEDVGDIVEELYLENQPKALISCERDYPIGSTKKIRVLGEGTCSTGVGRCTHIGDGTSQVNDKLRYVWKFHSNTTGACAYFSQNDATDPVAYVSTRFINFFEPDITRLTVRPGRNGRLYVIAKTNELRL